VSGVVPQPAGAAWRRPERCEVTEFTAAHDADCASCEWIAPFRVDIRLTLIVHRRGSHDPTFLIDPSGAIWRTSLTPVGPATLRLTADGADLRGVVAPARPLNGQQASHHAPSGPATGLRSSLIRAQAWGPGAGWLLDQVPDLLGARDAPEGFQPEHPVLRELARRFAGMRIGRTDRVLEALIPAVLEQKVVGREARRAWRYLVSRYGSPAPGPVPAGLRVVPSPAAWQAIPSWEWHRAGVEAVRARTVTTAARLAGRLEAVTGLPGEQADRLLQSLPGIGRWTAAEVRQRACGDADAVSVGDYHIPGQVGWVLAGEPADDDRMLELLAPYAGQRYRVTRLIEISGQGPPRRGPRMSVRDYSAI
jgi:3-methyladenine DNA glycosylase/8-oxoguanine DNA glycosylase